MYSLITCTPPVNAKDRSFIWDNLVFNETNETEPVTLPVLISSSKLPWRDLKVAASELRPELCLTTGQSFSWKRLLRPSGFSIENAKVEDYRSRILCGPHKTKQTGNRKDTGRGLFRYKTSESEISDKSTSSNHGTISCIKKRKNASLAESASKRLKTIENKRTQKYKGENHDQNVSSGRKESTGWRFMSDNLDKSKENIGHGDSPEWIGVIDNKIFVLKQTENSTLFKRLFPRHSISHTQIVTKEPHGFKNEPSTQVKTEEGNDEDEEEDRRTLSRFFRLEICLADLIKGWFSDDPYGSKVAAVMKGARLLHITPIEAIFTFICSSNNNITRITQMVDRLRQRFGKPLLVTTGEDVQLKLNPAQALDMKRFTDSCSISLESNVTVSNEILRKLREYKNLDLHVWFGFPLVSHIAQFAFVGDLRLLGFGFRAESISKAAQQLIEIVRTFHSGNFNDGIGGTDLADKSDGLEDDFSRYFSYLSSCSRETCQRELMRLRGVGPKVADCISSLCLNQLDSVPVDTHIWKIASERLDNSLLRFNRINKAAYISAGDLFRSRYKPYPAWAASILFAAELKTY